MANSMALLPLHTLSSSFSPLRQKNVAAATQRDSWQLASHNLPVEPQCSRGTVHFHQRREFVYGLIAFGLGSSLAPVEAHAAKRRPPPPPPVEKTDPNVSGVLAKVLASKKRKEAMKEAVAKLREQGKAIN
ncbi:hypothetical protein Cni_G12363 [Canna indica]|uniref:Uncharacterized protein n=1 Tax=Canna indica TaxID=4628 RepID=A0AAQ3QC29_9LILI|nr:hypothetical protein Cni_G12363 [Canna indica]